MPRVFLTCSDFQKRTKNEREKKKRNRISTLDRTEFPYFYTCSMLWGQPERGCCNDAERRSLYFTGGSRVHANDDPWMAVAKLDRKYSAKKSRVEKEGAEIWSTIRRTEMLLASWRRVCTGSSDDDFLAAVSFPRPELVSWLRFGTWSHTRGNATRCFHAFMTTYVSANPR